MKELDPKTLTLALEELGQRISPDSVVAAGASGSGSAGNAVSNGSAPQPINP